MSKPSIPKGTRDFLPHQVAQRKYIFDTIEKVFKLYGYQTIETPVMENLSTLTGKYGDEGDQLLFKVLNNGDFLNKADQKALQDRNSRQLALSISKRGLRYDLTVPFARYVVMHQNEISFPFKRYAIQPVWRADRPQKGRYQEFYQCDVDVVGSRSLLYEAELVKIYDEIFRRLGINVIIKVNNRKILSGIADVAGVKDRFTAMAVAIDKLDKIGINKVNEELLAQGFSNESISTINNILEMKTLAQLEEALQESETGLQGVTELREFHDFFDLLTVHNKVELDIKLARGLSYYTGCIFEVKALDADMGSIGGGGRYDDLTGMFGLKDVSGVGISLGAERIYDVMKELNLFETVETDNTHAIFIAMDRESLLEAFRYADILRNRGIAIDVYPDVAKMKKQMKYANGRGFDYVLIIGENERINRQIMVKELQSGHQELMSLDQLSTKLSTK